MVNTFVFRKPVYGRQDSGQTHQIYMRRFTILRIRSPFEINELPPTSPPPPATYPFGFLSPASTGPEVHPAVGIMRVRASSSNVSAAHPHCFRRCASRNGGLRPPRFAGVCSPLADRHRAVPGPVPAPGPHATFGVMFDAGTSSLCASHPKCRHSRCARSMSFLRGPTFPR